MQLLLMENDGNERIPLSAPYRIKILDTLALYRRSRGTYLDFPALNYVLFARNTTRMEKEIRLLVEPRDGEARTEGNRKKTAEREKREDIIYGTVGW